MQRPGEAEHGQSPDPGQLRRRGRLQRAGHADRGCGRGPVRHHGRGWCDGRRDRVRGVANSHRLCRHPDHPHLVQRRRPVRPDCWRGYGRQRRPVRRGVDWGRQRHRLRLRNRPHPGGLRRHSDGAGELRRLRRHRRQVGPGAGRQRQPVRHRPDRRCSGRRLRLRDRADRRRLCRRRHHPGELQRAERDLVEPGSQPDPRQQRQPVRHHLRRRQRSWHGVRNCQDCDRICRHAHGSWRR